MLSFKPHAIVHKADDLFSGDSPIPWITTLLLTDRQQRQWVFSFHPAILKAELTIFPPGPSFHIPHSCEKHHSLTQTWNSGDFYNFSYLLPTKHPWVPFITMRVCLFHTALLVSASFTEVFSPPLLGCSNSPLSITSWPPSQPHLLQLPGWCCSGFPTIENFLCQPWIVNPPTLNFEKLDTVFTWSPHVLSRLWDLPCSSHSCPFQAHHDPTWILDFRQIVTFTVLCVQLFHLCDAAQPVFSTLKSRSSLVLSSSQWPHFYGPRSTLPYLLPPVLYGEQRE